MDAYEQLKQGQVLEPEEFFEYIGHDFVEQAHEELILAGNRYIATAIKNSVQRVLDAKKGDRNNALNRNTYFLAKMIPVLTEKMVREAMLAAGEAAGLEKREVNKTVDSAIKKGIRDA